MTRISWLGWRDMIDGTHQDTARAQANARVHIFLTSPSVSTDHTLPLCCGLGSVVQLLYSSSRLTSGQWSKVCEEGSII